MSDTRYYATAQMITRANNPKGLGWKKHGWHGRFVKRYWLSDDDTISCLWGIVFGLVVMLVFLVWRNF